jgi:phosphate transport system permease protein
MQQLGVDQKVENISVSDLALSEPASQAAEKDRGRTLARLALFDLFFHNLTRAA